MSFQNKTMILRTVAFLSSAFVLTLLGFPAEAVAESVLVKRGQEGWHYWGEGERPPEAWNTEGFDDSTWHTGTAPLGCGVGGLATTISYGEDGKNKPVVAFFRLPFNVDDPNAQKVWLGELRCDDGAAVYLNGQEIYRYNMPQGDLAEATFAAGELSDNRESTYHAFYLDGGRLKTGENVLAVSVHESDTGSGGLLMDFALAGADGASVPEEKPLDSDGVFDDVAISLYIDRWARHLQKQDHAPNPTRMVSGLSRILDREVSLIEPSDTPLSTEEIYERCAAGVLIISSVTEGSESPPSHASGFVISEDGLALTNFHVMGPVGQRDFVATTLSGRVVRVKEVIAASQANDVALIQLEGDGFQPLPIAKSARVGSDLVIISHPGDSNGPTNEFFTLTKGHLARHRSFMGQPWMMVTTPYAGGSSGAPILDRFGCVAGMVSRSRPFVSRMVPVHEKDGALKMGTGERFDGLFLSMAHQMTLGIAVPCRSMRAFLTPLPLGEAQSVEAPNSGLNWQLYEGSWGALPDFSNLEPKSTGTCDAPAVDAHGGRTDDYALVFTGFVDLPTEGIWQFRVTSDDGSRLFIDDELVVDNDGIHPPVARSCVRRLAAGLHAIRVEFFERGNGEVLRLEFSGPGQTWTEIPASAFRRPAAADEVAESRLAEILAGGTPETVDELRALQGHVQRLAKRVLPATVSLSSSSGVLVRRDDRIYALGTAHTTRSAGRKMLIRTTDERNLQGVTLGADHGSDVGLVQVDTEGEHPAVEIGASADLKRGQWVLMLGHPSGRKPGRTAPVRLGRVLGVAKSGYIVTDCTMQGGDSGGPLFDMNGRVVGINSACTPNLAANLHGPIDALVKQWAELQEGKATQATRSKVNPLGVVLAKSLSQGDAMRKPWTSIVARANPSVVRVLVGDEERALGTAVATDLVVTKYSELAVDDDNAKRTCRQGTDSWPYSIVGYDRPADLALLRIVGGRLEPIVWRDTTLGAGSFLASPGGDDEPFGIGVLSAAPYQHTQPHILLGVWFKNWFEGPAELQHAIENGSAHAAGLRDGDVVVQFGPERIDNGQQLLGLLSQRRLGDKVDVSVKRDDAELTFEVTLGSNFEFMRSPQEVVWGPLSEVRRGFATILQHDTVLKPEHCGGPLIDLSGRAIGLNIARAGRVETLALPAGEVQRLVTRLLTASQQAKPAGKTAEESSSL